MKLGIIGAIRDEVSLFLEDMSEIKESTAVKRCFFEGRLQEIDTVITYGGMCKVNAAIAAQVLISQYNCTHIIVSGVAGGIDTSLHIGDTVIADTVCYHDVDDMVYTDHPKINGKFFLSDEKLLTALKKGAKNCTHKIVTGTIVTGDAFIEDNGRQEIINRFSPMCVDMETAAIAHVCYVNDIPFAAVRSISDTAEEKGIGSFETNCKRATQSSYKVVTEGLLFLSE